jgi:hypothetical protein
MRRSDRWVRRIGAAVAGAVARVRVPRAVDRTAPALYADAMSKHITIRVDEEFHARLAARAAAEGTTITALVTEVAKRELDADRQRSLDAAAEFNTAENWAYFQDRFGRKTA